MKKHFLSAALFILPLTGILFLSGFLFVPKNNTKAAGITDASANGILGEPENSIDVLFLGDSLAYSAFVPLHIYEESGCTSYVCATGAQQLQYTEALLRQALDNQSPKTVFLEVNCVYRDVNFGTVLYAKLYDAFSVFRYHDRWKNLTWEDLTGKADYTWTDDDKGYRYFAETEPADTTGYMAPSDVEKPIPQMNRAIVKTLKTLCESHGASLVLISVPSVKSWNMKQHNGIVSLASDLSLPYIDLNLTEIGVNWETDTRDQGDHLNISGAIKVTDYILSYLQENGPLPDHRADPAYKGWTDALARIR